MRARHEVARAADTPVTGMGGGRRLGARAGVTVAEGGAGRGRRCRGRRRRRDRLAARRRALGLTQEDLAGLLGVERSTVGRWERGTTQPLPWIRPKLARALQVPAGQLAELLDGAPAGPDGRGPAAAPVPRQLPAAVADFTGRAGELAALTRMLEDGGAGAPGTVVISAIGGTAGVGKTALALHWAHQVARRFPGGQLHVNLRGFDPGGTPATPAQAIRGLPGRPGCAGRAHPGRPDAQAGLYRSLMADRSMLVVLDNARDEQQVRPLLPASPASLVLVTSRNQLAGLRRRRRPAAHPRRAHPAEAVQLLTARLGAARAAAEPAAVDRDRRAVRVAAAGAGGGRGPGRRPGRVPAGRAGRRTAQRQPGGWTPWMPETRRPACGRYSPGPTSSSAPARRGCSGCWACTPAPTSPSRPPPASPPRPDRGAPPAARAGPRLPDRRARPRPVRLPRPAPRLRRRPGPRLSTATPSATKRLAGSSTTTCTPPRPPPVLLDPTTEPVALAPPRPGTAAERPAAYQQALAWFEAEHHVLLAAVTLADSTGFDRYAWQLPWAMTPSCDVRGHYQERAAIARIRAGGRHPPGRHQRAGHLRPPPGSRLHRTRRPRAGPRSPRPLPRPVPQPRQPPRRGQGPPESRRSSRTLGPLRRRARPRRTGPPPVPGHRPQGRGGR